MSKNQIYLHNASGRLVMLQILAAQRIKVTFLNSNLPLIYSAEQPRLRWRLKSLPTKANVQVTSDLKQKS